MTGKTESESWRLALVSIVRSASKKTRIAGGCYPKVPWNEDVRQLDEKALESALVQCPNAKYQTAEAR